MNKKLECSILFSDNPGNTHVCQILAGIKMLETQGALKISSVKPVLDFRSSGHYEHNSIVEVNFGEKLLAYDLADGYQSIHRRDVFDKQLDRLSFYFKRSYFADFHKGMRNLSKIKPLGLNYLCTCDNNPYDKFYKKSYGLAEIKRFAVHIKNRKRDKFLYTVFESNERSYNSYNLIFLTRIWDYSSIRKEEMKKLYPYFTEAEAELETEKWKQSLKKATFSRINYIKELREHFGERVLAGVNRDTFSEQICPDLIVPDELTDRHRYLELIKSNFVCITSEGLHHSIGWKLAEYVAAGKAILSEPLYYEVPYGFNENDNYFSYDDVQSLICKCEALLENIDLIYQMEENNRLYYRNHLRPDMLVKDTLKVAKIL